MSTADPAVTAAAEAMQAALTCERECAVDHAEVAVLAARPIIEAEVRERIAAEIEERIEPPDEEPCVNGPMCPECIDGAALHLAARIARGGNHD